MPLTHPINENSSVNAAALLRKILSLSALRFVFFHKKLHNPIDHNGFAWNPFFERGSSWMKKEKKKGRKKSWPEVFMVNLCNLCSWQCANVKSATCYGWWCFTGHFFHDSCCISDMKCKCQGSSQSLLAVTVIFLFGSVLFDLKKIGRPISNWSWTFFKTMKLLVAWF